MEREIGVVVMRSSTGTILGWVKEKKDGSNLYAVGVEVRAKICKKS